MRYPVLLMLVASAALAVEPSRYATVHVKPPRYDAERDFHSLLRVELLKKKGLVPVTISLTDDPDQADIVLEVHLGRRDASWHEGMLTPAKPTAMVSVVALDHCGQALFVKTKGDATIWGSAGPVLSAQRMALSFKEALHKKRSRLNKTRRERPCLFDEDEGHYVGRPVLD